MRVIALCLLAALATPAVALADPEKDASSDCALARKQNKVCKLEIEAEAVDGKVPTTGEQTIAVDTFGKHGSLIRIRTTFIPEILKTAEDL